MPRVANKPRVSTGPDPKLVFEKVECRWPGARKQLPTHPCFALLCRQIKPAERKRNGDPSRPTVWPSDLKSLRPGIAKQLSRLVGQCRKPRLKVDRRLDQLP
jgi:hypothetical protein